MPGLEEQGKERERERTSPCRAFGQVPECVFLAETPTWNFWFFGRTIPLYAGVLYPTVPCRRSGLGQGPGSRTLWSGHPGRHRVPRRKRCQYLSSPFSKPSVYQCLSCSVYFGLLEFEWKSVARIRVAETWLKMFFVRGEGVGCGIVL